MNRNNPKAGNKMLQFFLFFVTIQKKATTQQTQLLKTAKMLRFKIATNKQNQQKTNLHLTTTLELDSHQSHRDM